MFFIENLRNEYTDKASFVRFSYVVNVKTIFFRENCVILKSCKWPFVSRLLKVQRGTAGKKKEGDILCLDDYAGVKSFKSPSAGFRHEKAFSIINSCGLLWSSMHTNVTPHVGFQDSTSFASIAMIENRASST